MGEPTKDVPENEKQLLRAFKLGSEEAVLLCIAIEFTRVAFPSLSLRHRAQLNVMFNMFAGGISPEAFRTVRQEGSGPHVIEDFIASLLRQTGADEHL